VLAATKADAERILAKHIRDRDLELAGMSGESGLSMPIAVLVDQYLGELRARAKTRTIEDARLALARLVKDLRLATVRDISKPALLRWRQERIAAGAANKTVNNQVGALKAALNLAVRLGQLQTSPLHGFSGLPVIGAHQRRRPRALSDWEISRLLAAALEHDRTRCGVPREPLLRALILTGARWGELTRATWADLDVERATLTLRAETTKTGCERAIPLDSGLLETLVITGRRFCAKPGSRIFLAPRGKPWPANTGPFRHYLHELLARCGIPIIDDSGRRVHVHALRHTFATRLARAGVPVQTAQLLTGHRTASVLLGIYTHLRVEESRKAIEGLPELGVVGSLEKDAAGASGGVAGSERDNTALACGSGSPSRARTYNPAVNSPMDGVAPA